MNYLRSTWAEINSSALIHNFNKIRSLTDAKIFSVIKANAYGHSVELVAPILDKAGTDYFAVSNLEEAKEIRALGIKKPVLILGYTPPERAYELEEYNLIQTVFSVEFAEKLNDCAERAGVIIHTHLKLDTGMGRLGFVFRNEGFESLEEIKKLKELKNLTIDGVFTHFASADVNTKFTNEQYNRFVLAVKCLEESGFTFKLKHCCNSAGVLNHKEMHLDAVRPGIILYGLTPDTDMDTFKDLKPVMSFKSVVSLVKNVKAGETVSYGQTYTFERDSKIATVTAGYADGVCRLLSNKGRVMIGGKYASIVGRICMDQFCIDVTDIEGIKSGDVVTLFGDGLPVEEFAANADTINYEVVCGLTKRVPRVLIED